VPLDPRSPLHRFRVDPRAVRRAQIDRLEALGVELQEISSSRGRRLLDRFLHEFLDPRSAAQVSAELARPPGAARPLDFDRWLRPECVRRGERGSHASHQGGSAGCVAWLLAGSTGAPAVPCVRFERRPDLPALAIDLATLDDAWAASWPGLFVSFEAGRAVVITLDYEEVRCDVRAARATPYR
jgi:hypothetical protein